MPSPLMSKNPNVVHLLACRGGVSNKPPFQIASDYPTRLGSLSHLGLKLQIRYVGLLFTQNFNFNHSDILAQSLYVYSFEESRVSALWVKIHFFRPNEHSMNAKMGPYFNTKICLYGAQIGSAAPDRNLSSLFGYRFSIERDQFELNWNTTRFTVTSLPSLGWVM
eukprot:sb/3472532/